MTSVLQSVAPAAGRFHSGQSNEQPVDPKVRKAVRGLLSRLSPLVARDRRRYARQPMPMLLELTPVDAQTLEPVGSPMVVVGKSLSEVGIGFFHQHAIPYRRALVRMETLPTEPQDVTEPEKDDAVFLVDLSWCRYTRFGWYESGGRFLKVIETGDGCADSSHRHKAAG